MPIDASIPLQVRPIPAPDIIGPFERVQGMRLKERAQSLDEQQFEANQANQAAVRKTQQLETARKGLEIGSQILATVKDEASYQRALPILGSMGVDVTKFPTAYDPKFIEEASNWSVSALDKLKAVEQQAKNELAQFNLGKDRELAPFQTRKAEADAQKAEAEAQAATAPKVAPRPAQLQEFDAYKAMSPEEQAKYKEFLNLTNKSGVAADPANVAEWKFYSGLPPQQQTSYLKLHGRDTGGGGVTWTDDAINAAADVYATTGQLPNTLRGAAGTPLAGKIMDRAKQRHPDLDPLAKGADYKADSATLTAIQKNVAAVDAFENTAGKNLDTFLATAKKVIDTGIPLVNAPLRMLDEKILGGVDQTAFNAARQTALTEISKVLNNPTLSGQLSDSARHEVMGLIGPNATLKQIYSAASILKQDMAARKDAYSKQIAEIRKRISGRFSQGDEQPVSPPVPQPKATKSIEDLGKQFDF